MFDADTDALFDAIRSGEEERARELLLGRPALAAARDREGLTPLLRALYARREATARLLQALRSEPDLFEAAAAGLAPVVARLLDAEPAGVDARSPDGFTPLHLAAFFGHAEVARVLLGRGADARAVSKNAMEVQPLHSAAAGGHHDVAAVLLEHGADPNARQHGGFTPLHARAAQGDARMVALLLAHGADPRERAGDGRNAFDFASAGRHEEVLALLWRRGRQG